MGFFDLHIPYHESDRHATDKPSLRGRRLKLALKAMELGFTGVAYNRTLKGVMSESDRCSTTLFPISKLTPSSSSFFASVKFHREILNVPASAPFRQYTRLTVIVDSPSQASALNAGNPVLRSYDVVAVRPMNQTAFDQACKTSEVDIIAIDFSEKMQLPFRLKQPMVKAAIKRGVYFEITYSGLILDAQSRRQTISNCKLLVDWTRGKNIILSSAATSATELRGPQDVANLFSLLGLPRERAKAAISSNCRSLLANALRKKHFYKEAVKVEAIQSGGQVNPVRSPFDDWLNWDPISSGQGDLLLDDMEKFSATSKTAKKNVKSVNFTSKLNGLPAHGLQIKDLIYATKTALQPPDADKLPLQVMETEGDALDEKLENQGGLKNLDVKENNLFKNSLFNPSKDHGEAVELPEGEISPSAATDIHLTSDCQDSGVPLGYVPKAKPALLPLLGQDQISVDVAKIGNQISDLEDSLLSLPTFSCKSTNLEEILPTSNEKLKYSNDLEVNFLNDSEQNIVLSEAKLSDAPSPIQQGNCLHEGGQVHIMKISFPDINYHVPLELSNPLSESRSSAFPNEPDVEICDMGDVLPPEGSSKIATTNFDDPMDDVMGELKHSVTDYQGIAKSQAGMSRRKRKSPHQPFFFPFKHVLKPRPSKKKPRK